MSENSPLPEPGHDVTRLLHAWRAGDPAALDQLMPLVYSQLHALARRYMRQEDPGHTLNTTALVHEAYLRLFHSEISVEDRAHFFALAARTMRRVLVDHARAAQRQKRGGKDARRLPMEDAESEASFLASAREPDILDLDAALERLSKQDERKGRLMEMVYFAGLNCDEAAAVLAVSVATVNRDLRFARAWLRNELKEAAAQRGDI
jgi:RNA polymerase sigma factor (TIGR02999 family)